MSPCAPVTAADVPLDSRDTSSQESNEPLRVAGAGRLSRKSRSAMSSRQSLAADAADQADTPRKARTQAHAMLDLQRQQMVQERCQLQVRLFTHRIGGWQPAACTEGVHQLGQVAGASVTAAGLGFLLNMM